MSSGIVDLKTAWPRWWIIAMQFSDVDPIPDIVGTL
jgi:hypothetical protein